MDIFSLTNSGVSKKKTISTTQQLIIVKNCIFKHRKYAKLTGGVQWAPSPHYTTEEKDVIPTIHQFKI